MHFRVILRIIGTLLMVFSLTLLVPAILGWFAKDGAAGAFVQSFFVTFSSGTVMWLFVRKQRNDLNIRDGFLIVALFWGVLGLFGALPCSLMGSSCGVALATGPAPPSSKVFVWEPTAVRARM